MRFIAVSFLLLMSASLLSAQTSGKSHHWLSPGVSDEISRSAVTKSGGPVVSFPCDPLMTAKQERALAVALMKESPFHWVPGMSLSNMAAELSEQVPVLLDRRALEEIGIDPDSPIGAGVMTHQHADSQSRRGERERWWQRDEAAVIDGRPSLVVDVLSRLKDLYLTLMIVRGQVVITTVEAAEDDLATRIYDVTPLISMRAHASWGASHATHGVSEAYADFDSLINILETSVAPDTWEALGGNSTTVGVTIRDRHWIVVSTTTMTHWKIQRLLDRLNQ
ncbi:hypothetical protein Enr13x_70520 [Stieleria neptunia]|uniref:Uncharacterized protein n=1 Tax=Stieleria neptunia TaxID=2527979 RepID=A0A518I200_9BACT|nr:hypothetical protein [Stieleria neptunia]QDV47143.1 hypothetical protein Enr13x_70520 [Stieleria neptunia]